MPLRCICRQIGGSRYSAAVRRMARVAASPPLTGANCTPVATPAASAIGLASITVSARPPTRATTGTAP